MSYGNVRHPQAVWIDRIHTAIKMIPKILVLGSAGMLINAGVTYGFTGITFVGVCYLIAAILMLGRK